jgi:gliding motility-associated-like protein
MNKIYSSFFTLFFLILLHGQTRSQDVGITTIASPVSGCNLTCPLVTVVIYNWSNFMVGGQFNVCYTVNAGSPNCANFVTNIMPGGTYTYTFPNAMCANIANQGTYNIKTWVTMLGDINPNNDTLTTTVVNDTTVVGGNLAGSTTVCASANNGVIILTGNTGYITNWESSPDGSTWTSIGNNGNPSYNYNNLTATTYYRVLLDGGYCPDGVSPVAVINVDQPTNPGILVGSVTACPAPNSGPLDVTGYNGNILHWSYSVDGGVTWNIINHTGSNYNFLNLTQTTIYHVVSQNGVCPPDTSNNQTVTITSPSVGGNILSSVTECYGNNNSTLTLVNYSGNILFWMSSTDGGVTWTPIANTTPTQPYTNLTQTTTYTAVVQNNGCPYDTATPANITIVPLPNVSISPSNTVTFSLGDSACFVASGAVLYNWSPASDFVDPNIANACFWPTNFGTYTLTVTGQDANGCTNTATVNVIVLDTTTIPNQLIICNYITPNNDGFNDAWNIIGIEFYPDNNVKIVNNHGQIVYEKSSYKNDWKGTYNGDKLPDGSYYYFVDVKHNINKTYKGTLTIVGSN